MKVPRAAATAARSAIRSYFDPKGKMGPLCDPIAPELFPEEPRVLVGDKEYFLEVIGQRKDGVTTMHQKSSIRCPFCMQCLTNPRSLSIHIRSAKCAVFDSTSDAHRAFYNNFIFISNTFFCTSLSSLDSQHPSSSSITAALERLAAGAAPGTRPLSSNVSVAPSPLPSPALSHAPTPAPTPSPVSSPISSPLTSLPPPLATSSPVVRRCTRSVARRLHLSASPSPSIQPCAARKRVAPDHSDAPSKRQRLSGPLSGLEAVEAELIKVGLPADDGQRGPGLVRGRGNKFIPTKFTSRVVPVSGGRKATVQDVPGDGYCQSYSVLHAAFRLHPQNPATQVVCRRFRELVAEGLMALDDERKETQAAELRVVYPAVALGMSDSQLFNWYVSGFVNEFLYGDNLTLVVMADLLGVQINVIQRASPDIVIYPGSAMASAVLNVFLDVEHYMSVVSLK